MPVLTGIGHERDSTVLDEVAHQRFDTPSKVVAGIQALIVKRARESQAPFDEVAGLAARQLRTSQKDVDDLADGIQRRALGAVTGRSRRRARAARTVQRSAQRTLHDAAQGVSKAMSGVRTGASGRISAARIGTASLATEIRVEAAAGAQHSASEPQELLDEVERLARNTLALGRRGGRGHVPRSRRARSREDARPRLRGRAQRDRRDRHQRRRRRRRQEPAGAVPGRIDRRLRAP